ncbi:MAG TPA: tetratricopeptide repeat protein [Candidatus Limnocylindrales bacterium]|nr:tetratricopeptide repeat protein [Candidatus Limnocylindrales bacterium]
MTVQAAGDGSTLASELDRMRRCAGLSFRDLSRLTGHPVSTLHNALTGRVFPRLDTVLAIVRACGQDEGHWRERWADFPNSSLVPKTPRELPRSPRAFVGRELETARLAALVERERDHGVGIVAVYGMPGVGKTAFAVQAAHQLCDRFPDGQLFIDLRGHRAGAEPMAAAEALFTLLRSLGVAAHSIPAALDGQIRLYRTVVSERRMLVVLDDALNDEQVRALVPSGAGCMVIVTSRHRLDGILALDGAHAFNLDVLSEAESRTLLASLLGEHDSTELSELAKLCGYLPLALRVAAANVAIHPHTRVAEAVAELTGDPMERLRMPADGQVAVQAAFARSYRRLSATAGTLLRRLGAAPCGQFTVDSAAALLGLPARDAQQALDEIEAGCLIDRRAGRRYGMHDLVRLFALERAQDEEDGASLGDAFDRLLEWCRWTADAAARVLYPESLRLPTKAAPPTATIFDDRSKALAWLDDELENLVAVVVHASRHRPQAAAWSLADSLRGYFVLRFRPQEWSTVAEAGLRAAELQSDRLAQGAMRHSLGVAHVMRGEHAAGEQNLAEALALYRAAGWADGSTAILIGLGGSYFHEGRLDEASRALEEALSLATRHNLPIREAAALGDLGEVYRDRGLLHRAHDHQVRTARRCRELGMARGQAIAQLCLGLVCVELGELTEARRHFDDAHQRVLALGSRDGESYAVLGLAAVDLETGKPDQALARAEQALAVAESIAEDSLVVEACLVRAEALRQLEQPGAALVEATRAGGLAEAKGYFRGIPRSLIVLAGVESDLGRLGDARTTCLRALDLSRHKGYQVAAGRALTTLATIDHESGEEELATKHAHEALALHRQTGHRLGEAKTLLLLGRLCESTGEHEAAQQHRRASPRR